MSQNMECVKSLIGFRRIHSNKSFEQGICSFAEIVVRPQKYLYWLNQRPDLGLEQKQLNLNTSSKMHCRAMLRQHYLVTWPLTGKYNHQRSLIGRT